MTHAEKAVATFNKTNSIVDLGQRKEIGYGPGTVHIFTDGSIAVHWTDGKFTLAEIKALNVNAS